MVLVRRIRGRKGNLEVPFRPCLQSLGSCTVGQSVDSLIQSKQSVGIELISENGAAHNKKCNNEINLSIEVETVKSDIAISNH
jgi:hypothetical protein